MYDCNLMSWGSVLNWTLISYQTVLVIIFCLVQYYQCHVSTTKPTSQTSVLNSNQTKTKSMRYYDVSMVLRCFLYPHPFHPPVRYCWSQLNPQQSHPKTGRRDVGLGSLYSDRNINIVHVTGAAGMPLISVLYSVSNRIMKRELFSWHCVAIQFKWWKVHFVFLDQNWYVIDGH
jgi:hypothetical protein